MSSSANETETFQHYQVAKRDDGALWELGRGAMGITYKAFDTNLRCDVALKVINALHLDSDTARARFQREARAAAGLRHRNVATVYHLGNDDQSFFYAMEFVDGETVECLVKKRGPMAPADALQIVVQVARALGAAARQNLVHRDIKPANIMVVHEDEDEDQYIVKVIDFGLARPALGGEGSAHITMGGFVGTPQFASPEQLEEKDLDARSDIYSLGITLWYMLAGKPPFTGPLGSVFIQQLTKPPPWEQLSDTPESVRKLLAHMLQKDPALRQQSPVELRREIEACLKTLASSREPSGAAAVAGDESATSDTTAADTAAASTGNTAAATDAVDIIAPAPAADLEIASSSARTAVLTVGSLLGGRYELARLVGEGNNGRVFHAFDVERNRAPVAVKILHSDVLVSTAERRRFETDLSKLRLAPHPNLLEVYGLEEVGDTSFLVSEWVNGFTLVDLLRSRGQLPLRETIRLLAQAVAAADHARAQDLLRIELGLHQILAHFPTLPPESDSEAGTKTALNRPLDQWPDFALKIDALGITREAGDSMTWAGDMTMMPAAPVLGRDTQTSIRGLIEGSDLFAIGLLTYELLDGAPPAVNQRDGGREARYVALSALNEPANAVLRRALSPNPGFASNTEFLEALLKASGLTMALPSASSVPAVLAPLLSASETPETSTPSDTLILDELPASKTAAPIEDESASTLVLGEGESIAAPVSDPRESASGTVALRDRPLNSTTTPDSTVALPQAMPVERVAPEEPPGVSGKGTDFEDVAQTVLLDSTSFLTPPETVESPIAAKPAESPFAESSSSQTRPLETPLSTEAWIQTRAEAPVPAPTPAEELPKPTDFPVEKEAAAVESATPPLVNPTLTEIPAKTPVDEAVVSSSAASEIPLASPASAVPLEQARMDRADISLDYPVTRPAEETSLRDRCETIQNPPEAEAPKSLTSLTVAPLPRSVAPGQTQLAPAPEPEPQGGGSKPMVLVSAAAVILVIGVAVVMLGKRGNHQPEKQPIVVVRPTPAPSPETVLRPPPVTPAPTVAVAVNIPQPTPPVTVEQPFESPAPTASNEEKAGISNSPSPVVMPTPMTVESTDESTPPAPSPTAAQATPRATPRTTPRPTPQPAPKATPRPTPQSTPRPTPRPTALPAPRATPKPIVTKPPDKPAPTPDRSRGAGVPFMH